MWEPLAWTQRITSDKRKYPAWTSQIFHLRLFLVSFLVCFLCYFSLICLILRIKEKKSQVHLSCCGDVYHIHMTGSWGSVPWLDVCIDWLVAYRVTHTVRKSFKHVFQFSVTTRKITLKKHLWTERKTKFCCWVCSIHFLRKNYYWN